VVASRERTSRPSAEDPLVATLLGYREETLEVEVVSCVRGYVEEARILEMSVRRCWVLLSQS
jgi:hypothetical protein